MLIMKNVSKTFNPGTVNEKCALKNLNLELKDGDFATIIGSNGAGKSTLFNAITGAFFIDRGLIVLDGEDITYQKEHVRSKVIGHLFQDPLKGTAPHMTIEENMALAYLRAKTSKNAYFSRINAADKAKFREHLALLDMGLEDRMKQPVGLLSGGQRQALTLLMATMVTPKILLLDEHTAALDPATAKKVLDLTKQIVAERKITCLMDPQYAPGIRTWKPYPDDGFRKYHLRCERRKTCGHDGGGSVRAVCGLCRKAFGQ